MNKLTIAIDGPSGAGKSTMAKGLAKNLDMVYLDTGAMYRAVTLGIMNAGIDPEKEDWVCEELKTLEVAVDRDRIFLNGEDVTSAIRKSVITNGVSLIASYACVREHLVKTQRQLASEQSIVLDGRDIGTVVLPNADYKFFLTADLKTRAERRYEELKIDEAISLEQVMVDLEIRDKKDSERKISPLKQAEDAYLIDSTHLSIEETIQSMIAIMEGN